MRTALLFAGVAGLGAAAWAVLANAKNAPAADAVTLPSDSLLNTIENFSLPVGLIMTDANLQAFLMLIRTGEGTSYDGGYSRLFGGGSFDSYADHPRISVTRNGLTSTAAGAYQILARTWDDLINAGNDLPDFTPPNQDVAAVALIKRRGALADVAAGRFDTAIAKCNREWASLPGSPYGQPTLTMARANQVLAQNGASLDGATA